MSQTKAIESARLLAAGVAAHLGRRWVCDAPRLAALPAALNAHAAAVEIHGPAGERIAIVSHDPPARPTLAAGLYPRQVPHVDAQGAFAVLDVEPAMGFAGGDRLEFGAAATAIDVAQAVAETLLPAYRAHLPTHQAEQARQIERARGTVALAQRMAAALGPRARLEFTAMDRSAELWADLSIDDGVGSRARLQVHPSGHVLADVRFMGSQPATAERAVALAQALALVAGAGDDDAIRKAA